MVKTKVLAILVITTFTLSGCTGLTGIVGCGEAYEEMYGGYDYVYATKTVDSQDQLTVILELVSGGGGWLEESEVHEANQDLWVGLDVKFSDGTVEEIAFRQADWENYGDGHDGSSWATTLTFTSPENFCQNGCEEVRFSAGSEDGFIYYDGTCDNSPWVDVD